MSQSSPQFVYTLLAGADLSAQRNRFAKITADNTVGVATANTDPVVGIIDDIPFNAAGAQVAIRFAGTAQVFAGAAYAAGAKLTTDASGRAVLATAGQTFHAIAIQAATAVGDLCEAFLVKGVA